MEARMEGFRPETSAGTQETHSDQLATVESQQTWEAVNARRNQMESLKSSLQTHSMKLTELCTKYEIDSHQAEAAHSQELNIVKRLQKEIRELDEKIEQTSLNLAAINANCQTLQSKVEGSVQFGKALSEHRPRIQKTVAETKMARDEERAAMDALGIQVDVLLADYAALQLKFVNELVQLRKEVHTERQTRVTKITQHNQKVSEIDVLIKETQLLSCKEQAINADHESAIENEHKQKLELNYKLEGIEAEFKAQNAMAGAKLDEIQSHIPKHRAGIERGIAMKRDYQKLIPLMKELEIDQEETKEFLTAIGNEKIEIEKNLELSTNTKMSAEQEISKTLEEIEKCVASEQAMQSDRATLIEKLQNVEDRLAEKNIEESGLEVYLQNLDETKMSIDKSKEQLISKFDIMQASIEKVNLEIQVNEEQLAEAKRQILDLEEKMTVLLGEIQQVEEDNMTVVAEKTEIEKALNETREQIEQMLVAKAELVEQVEAIDSKLENMNLEMTNLKHCIQTVELEVQSLLNKNKDTEEKIKAAISSSVVLNSQILDETANVEALLAAIKHNEEEIELTVANIEKAREVGEFFTMDYKQSSHLLKSAQLAKEEAIIKNNLVKDELQTANEMKESKDTELKIIEDELTINNAMESTNFDQAEVLNLLKLELTQEEEETLTMCADIKKAIDEKSMATRESLRKVLAFEEQKNTDCKAIAAAESDFNSNTAAELKVTCKLRELEASRAVAQMQHEKRLQAYAEEKRNANDQQRLLEELQACFEKASDEHLEQKEKVEALDLKVKELENTLADGLLNQKVDPELKGKSMKLKNERDDLEKAMQKFLEDKAVRRSDVRAATKKWSADKAALTEKLAREQLKLKELTSASSNISKMKSPTIPTAKSPCVGEPSATESLAFMKNLVGAGKTSKEKSPRTPTYGAKSPVIAGLRSKSPIISGSHKSPSNMSSTKVRQVEWWNVNASSTPISTATSNFQENQPPEKVENSPSAESSPIIKKRKKHN